MQAELQAQHAAAAQRDGRHWAAAARLRSALGTAAARISELQAGLAEAVGQAQGLVGSFGGVAVAVEGAVEGDGAVRREGKARLGGAEAGAVERLLAR